MQDRDTSSDLLIPGESPRIIQPSLARAVGANEAIVLQQVHYWLRRSNKIVEGKPWAYNTYEQWQAQLPWLTERGVKDIFQRLERRGLVISNQFDSKDWNQRKWYSIDYDRLDELVQQGFIAPLLEPMTDGTGSVPSMGHRVSDQSSTEWPVDGTPSVLSMGHALSTHKEHRVSPESTTETTPKSGEVVSQPAGDQEDSGDGQRGQKDERGPVARIAARAEEYGPEVRAPHGPAIKLTLDEEEAMRGWKPTGIGEALGKLGERLGLRPANSQQSTSMPFNRHLLPASEVYVPYVPPEQQRTPAEVRAQRDADMVALLHAIAEEQGVDEARKLARQCMQGPYPPKGLPYVE